MNDIPVPELLADLVGQELGVSDWFPVEQDRIDAFADATDDRQWLHIDPERAASGPYGATIAHGYLTLSLLPALAASAYRIGGVRARVNYGLERVRFPAVVRPGSRVRSRATLQSVEPTGDGLRIVVRHVVEVDGSDRPACVADTVTLLLMEEHR
jgi:acyl dehydratase